MQPNFQSAYKQLNPAQKQAVDTIEGPVLVIAGPGTGKTQLLALRIANILSKTDSLPSNILCLTFTESAAQNMRDRLVSIIGKDAYDITISTYHAFGSDLLRRYPDYFNADSELEPADDLTIDAIFREIMAGLPYTNPLKADIFLRDVKTLISDSKRALLEPKDLLQIATANQTFVENTSAITTKLLADMQRISKGSIGLFRNLLAATGQTDSSKLPASITSLQTLWQESLHEALAEVDSSGKTSALTQWKNDWLAKNTEGQFIVDGTEQNRKLRAAAAVYEQYLAALAERQLFDYDDMILRAIRGLESNADLRYSLQERFLYLLLDEYQDTNEAQSRLVGLLTDSPIHEGRPNVLAVGDDDQAIYAFQGAHYSHMYRFYTDYRDVLVVPLTQNYRSLPGILHLAEGISGQIENRLHKQFEAISKVIVSARPSGQAVIERLEFRTDLAEQAWVADKIAELIAGGQAPESIAVLAPKHKYLQSLVPFLQHNSVPISYERRENVLDDPIISQLVLMSNLVLHLGATNQSMADTYWPQVLSLDCWQVPTSTIWQLTWQVRDDDSSWLELLLASEQTRQIGLFFLRLSQIADYTPLELMIDYLVGIEPLSTNEPDFPLIRAPFYEHYFGEVTAESTNAASFLQLLSNLTTLRAGLRDYRPHNELLHLKDFITFVAANQAAGIQILNTSPYQESALAVKLQTVFKSKGQEYPVVFVLHATDEVWGGRARNSGSRISLPQNMTFIRYAGTTEDERLRLLYVAITRAADQLYITSHSADAVGRNVSHLKYLDEQPLQDGSLLSPLMPAGHTIVQQIDSQAIPTLADVTTYWHERHINAANQPELKQLLQPRLTNFQLSASALNNFIDVSRGGPSNYFMRAILRFPSAATPSSSYGDAIHETLQFIHDYNKRQAQLPSMDVIEAAFQKRLTRKRLDAQTHALLYDRGLICLDAYMAQRLPTIATTNRSEANFREEGVFVGKAHLTGKIDKLIIDEKAKTIVIVDYKTGKSHNRWTRETKMHFYRYQLYFYKLLVERSRTYRGYAVTDAYLEFVEPDNDGLIQELHATFDDAIMEQLCAIIEVVWGKTMLLDFPLTDGYTPDLKGIELFETWLLETAH
ncbi:MAG: uvrD [Candidatus Saccharibacteria bacterium]|nr:uvrD [Candidatus Saccharibacteria bacterium]